MLVDINAVALGPGEHLKKTLPFEKKLPRMYLKQSQKTTGTHHITPTKSLGLVFVLFCFRL
jgi:hypothetical protein